jgi:hypothetical protein
MRKGSVLGSRRLTAILDKVCVLQSLIKMDGCQKTLLAMSVDCAAVFSCFFPSRGLLLLSCPSPFLSIQHRHLLLS